MPNVATMVERFAYRATRGELRADFGAGDGTIYSA